MRKEVKEIKVPIVDIKFNDDGEIIDIIETGKFDTVIEVHIYADTGKVFQDKLTGNKCGNHIQLGTSKTEDNYIEVDK